MSQRYNNSWKVAVSILGETSIDGRENTMKKAIVLALVAPMFATLSAVAQDWPSKPVKIIVPFGAGATPDVVARLLADRMQSKLNQPFIIENKPGASGNSGTDLVAKASPDGSTIGVSILGPLAINTLLFSKLPYNPFTDLALITRVADQPSVLAVNIEVPVKDTAELIALLKREPGKLNFGSIGVGSLSHLAIEAIAMQSGTTLVHIPYGSSPQAVTALIRGDVQIACLPAISLVTQVQTGKIKLLAVSSAKRSSLLPDVPTLKEAGIDVEANAWIGLIAPARTPEPLITGIHREANDALRDPAIIEKLRTQYMQPLGTTPKEFKMHIDAEMQRWAPVIRAGNIKIN
jgi:tripartite-type tricarboxylate transporter receptor subunit TctC